MTHFMPKLLLPGKNLDSTHLSLNESDTSIASINDQTHKVGLGSLDSRQVPIAVLRSTDTGEVGTSMSNLRAKVSLVNGTR